MHNLHPGLILILSGLILWILDQEEKSVLRRSMQAAALA